MSIRVFSPKDEQEFQYQLAIEELVIPYLQKISPNFVRSTAEVFDGKSAPENILELYEQKYGSDFSDKIFVLNAQIPDNVVSLREYLMDEKKDTKNAISSAYREIELQLLYILYCMNDLNFVCNKFTPNTVMIETLQEPRTLELVITGKSYTFRTRYLVIIFDYTEAYQPSIGANPRAPINMVDTSRDYYTMYAFLKNIGQDQYFPGFYSRVPFLELLGIKVTVYMSKYEKHETAGFSIYFVPKHMVGELHEISYEYLIIDDRGYITGINDVPFISLEHTDYDQLFIQSFSDKDIVPVIFPKESPIPLGNRTRTLPDLPEGSISSESSGVIDPTLCSIGKRLINPRLIIDHTDVIFESCVILGNLIDEKSRVPLPVAVKIMTFDDGGEYERKVYEFLHENKQCHINFVERIESFTCTIGALGLSSGMLENMKVIKDQLETKVGVLVLRQIQHGTEVLNLHTLLSGTYTYRDLIHVVFQLLCVLRIMQNLQLKHGDFHTSNVLIEEVKEPVILSYVIAGIVYTFPTRYIVKVFDWDLSYQESLGNNEKLNNSICKQYGICNIWDSSFDFLTVFCMIETHRKKGNSVDRLLNNLNLSTTKYMTELPSVEIRDRNDIRYLKSFHKVAFHIPRDKLLEILINQDTMDATRTYKIFENIPFESYRVTFYQPELKKPSLLFQGSLYECRTLFTGVQIPIIGMLQSKAFASLLDTGEYGTPEEVCHVI